ncbi:lysM and putative peptidoglycan-binding domain-containing protein 3 isoform X1 [Anthonomus grandis grandis]|uniref:lysM and putative peptidoglycan-binding domain-containing protein 3 isoform X1 n=1 Tax=Anthonomus grandis grandis TaxID=2921223 RepID=UPI002166628E|nr:lysM and putative peptidoglycan-binding domain-containing protein 3 isoform X1 [Anthonomus grandis grandis]
MMKQRQGSKYYRRLDKRDKDSGDSSEGEETELFVKNKSPRREIPTVEKIVEENDTLQSLAIRYRCSIEELKRLNNIHKENEIFARRVVKVPHRPFLEALAPVHISGTCSPVNSNNPATAKLIDIDVLDSKLTEHQQEENLSEVNQIIFNSNIAHKESETSKVSSAVYTDEHVHLLGPPGIPQPDPIVSRLSCSGSDCDIPFPALIVFIICLIVAIPFILVFFAVEQHEHHLNHTTENGS